MSEHTTPVHISVVLDRSGSMASIADDIVGGFNTFLAEQRTHPGGGRITLAQFDGQDPFEILIDGEDLADAAPIEASRYTPRGNTPLLDAVGRMIARVDQGILARADDGHPIEDQVILIVTDGLENASREFDLGTVASMVETRRRRGWVFTFLGVDEATFNEAASMRFAVANTATWTKSAAGSKEMFSKLSGATSSYRSLGLAEKQARNERFLEEMDDSGE
jgi:Mg-chelatase subunit ChlD